MASKQYHSALRRACNLRSIGKENTCYANTHRTHWKHSRPPQLLSAMAHDSAGKISDEQLRTVQHEALRETIAHLEETGSPVITDGEQTKPSFATYPLTGLPNLAPDGVVIPFADGHARQLPRLSSGPFRYGTLVGTRPLLRLATASQRQRKKYDGWNNEVTLRAHVLPPGYSRSKHYVLGVKSFSR